MKNVISPLSRVGRTRERGRSVGALAMCALVLAGCATQAIPVVTLSGVVRNDTVLAGSVPADSMQLVRAGQAYRVEPEMPLELGDMLRTGSDTAAVISYPGGARAYLYPNTQVRIGSIIDDVGKVFVKVKGLFKVKTSFVTAGSEGTQYWVNVGARNETRVVVVEDVVSLESPTGAWASSRLQAGQQALYRGQNAAGVVSIADQAEIRRETEWVRTMDQRVPVKMTVNKQVVLATVLIGVAVGIFESGKSHSSSPPSSLPSPPPSPARTDNQYNRPK